MKLLVLNDSQIGLVDADQFKGVKGDPGENAVLPPLEELRGPPGTPAIQYSIEELRGPPGTPAIQYSIEELRGPPGTPAIQYSIEELRGPPGENFQFPDGGEGEKVWTWSGGVAAWRDWPRLGGVGYRMRFNVIDSRLTALEAASGGSGLPAGGTTGQVLYKISNSDGDAGWETIGSAAFQNVGAFDASGLATAAYVAAASDLSAHVAASDPHPGYLTSTEGDTAYVAKNGAITGATKTKITYDAKGLVNSGADATTADIADGLNKRYVTDAQQTVIGNTSGTNTGDQTITLTGDVTGSGTGSFATTFKTSPAFTGEVTILQAGLTTTSSNISSLGSAGTGNITVGSTANWPTTGYFAQQLEICAYTVVNATTINVTARARFGTVAGQTFGDNLTMQYALLIIAASITSVPNLSVWSSGSIHAGAIQNFNQDTFGAAFFAGLISGQPISTTAATDIIAGGNLQVGNGNVTWTSPTTRTIQQGLNAANPTDEIYQAKGARPGTDTNKGGSNLVLAAGKGTSAGALSSISLKSAAAVGGTTTVQTLVTGLKILGGTAVKTPYTVALLPAAATVGAGAEAFVTDSTVAVAAGLGLAPIGGGGFGVPVFVDNTPAWVIG